MPEATRRELTDAAKAYESLFVPALFRQWTTKMVDTATIRPGHRVLDVACGTGVLTREAKSRAGSGQVVGLDLNPGMIAVASGLAPDIEWREGAAELLPFADRSFDVVVSQFGLMFFRDQAHALREMMRVLTPGGRLVVAVWDAVDRMPAYASAIELLDTVAGTRAGDALRSPFTLGDRRRLAKIAADAGLKNASIETRSGTAEFPSIRVMIDAELRGWLPAMGVVLPEDQISPILEQAEHVLASYRATDGSMSFPISAHFLSADKL